MINNDDFIGYNAHDVLQKYKIISTQLCSIHRVNDGWTVSVFICGAIELNNLKFKRDLADLYKLYYRLNIIIKTF